MDLATVPGSLCWECDQSHCVPYAVGENLPGYFYDCQRDAGDRIPHPRVWPNYIDNPE